MGVEIQKVDSSDHANIILPFETLRVFLKYVGNLLIFREKFLDLMPK